MGRLTGDAAPAAVSGPENRSPQAAESRYHFEGRAAAAAVAVARPSVTYSHPAEVRIMSLETRHAIELIDIDAFTFECSRCHTRVTWPIQFDLDLPRACPTCGLVFGDENSDLQVGLSELLKGFRKVRHTLGRSDCPVAMRIKLKRSVIAP